MTNLNAQNKIRKVAFIYLTPGSGEYYITDELACDIQRRPQLGLQYLCAVLERRGIKTHIFDQTVSLFGPDWLREKLRGYDIAGFYCSDSQEDIVKGLCKKIKEQLDIKILVGGPSTLENPSFLDYGCDIVVYGEGEITLQEIIGYYNGEREIDTIKGIFYRNGNEIVKASAQELIKNLDVLPFPDRSKVDINAYYDYYLFGMKRPYITMITARGCLYRCSFCTSCNLWGNRYRRRSVDNVLSEIDEVVEKYSIRYIAFQDDVFGVTNDWIEDFCNKLLKRPYRIRWMVIFHPFSIERDTERILRLMKRAGCDTVSFGLQTAHSQILKNINRDPAEPQKLKRLLAIADNIGFMSAVSYIFGLPGDTKETIQTTIDYSMDCGATFSTYFTLSVLRGSEIERRYRDKPICELAKETVQELTVYASKRFYTRPKNILRIAYFVLTNPVWLINTRFNILSLLARVGFFKTKNK
jgi:radical SAM superfamily enzyme YgiQ (UPF0313 family)